MNRDLSNEEKDICAKQISFLLEENEELDYEITEISLKLDRGIAYSLKTLNRKYSEELKFKKDKLKHNELVIKSLNDQIEKGVEIKIKKVEDKTPQYTG